MICVTDRRRSLSQTQSSAYDLPRPGSDVALTPHADTSRAGAVDHPREAWNAAIAAMEEWDRDPQQFDEDDRPDWLILEGATVFAKFMRDSGAPAPTHVGPSGDGRVTFEWHEDGPGEEAMAEFVEPLKALWTVFENGRVVTKGWITWESDGYYFDDLIT